MAQYVYTMNRVGKVVPPKREILKDISLSFFPGAKIGVLGLNGAGKSTLLRIMAGIDQDYIGEARPQPGINVGYLPQEPELDDAKTVKEIVDEAVSGVHDALAELDQVYAAYAEPDAEARGGHAAISWMPSPAEALRPRCSACIGYITPRSH